MPASHYIILAFVVAVVSLLEAAFLPAPLAYIGFLVSIYFAFIRAD